MSDVITTVADIERVRERIRGMKTDRLSYSAIAREAGVGESTLNSWLNGKYNGDAGNIAEKMARWADAQSERNKLRAVLPRAPEFIMTPTVEAILGLLSYAQHVPTIGVVSGGAGIGKTVAIRHYKAENPNVFVLTGHPALKTPFSVLIELAAALGLAEKSADRRFSAIIDRLKGTGSLIILDEAHHLPTKVLDQLRAVYDLAEVGVAMLGNAGIYGRLEGAARTPDFAPLFRRIGMRLTLARPKAADIRALADAWGIEGAEERRVLSAIGMKPGALGGMTMTLRMAHMLAGGTAVTAANILDAYRQLNEVPLEGAP
jgi:DNA transposition AAA+ family ATPase